MQVQEFVRQNNLKYVSLFVAKRNSSCGLHHSANYDFIEQSCSSGHADVFLDWQSLRSKYNSYHVFAIKDPNNNSFRFIEVDSNRHVRLSSYSQTNHDSFNCSDNLLFLYKYSAQKGIWTLKHIKTEHYISFSSSNNRIILNVDETAAKVSIEEQNASN